MGQDKDPAPAVASASLSRREQSRFCRVTQSAKVTDDVGKSQSEVTLDVLEEGPIRLDLTDDTGDVRPEVTRIGRAGSLPGMAERLARITGSDEMNASTPRATVEGSEVAPDRRLAQGLVFHPGHEGGRSMGLPLDETNSSIAGLGDVQAEVEAGVAGAE